MSNKGEQIKKLHPYALTPPTIEGGRWQTCYKDEKGKRKNIKAQTQEELLDKLIPIYFSKSHIDKLTNMQNVREWLPKALTKCERPMPVTLLHQVYLLTVSENSWGIIT